MTPAPSLAPGGFSMCCAEPMSWPRGSSAPRAPPSLPATAPASLPATAPSLPRARLQADKGCNKQGHKEWGAAAVSSPKLMQRRASFAKMLRGGVGQQLHEVPEVLWEARSQASGRRDLPVDAWKAAHIAAVGAHISLSHSAATPSWVFAAQTMTLAAPSDDGVVWNGGVAHDNNNAVLDHVPVCDAQWKDGLRKSGVGMRDDGPQRRVVGNSHGSASSKLFSE